MDGSRNQHSYERLDEGKNEIRVFQLFPGKPDEIVQGRLHVVQLGAERTYAAISYMWGDSKLTYGIHVDENPNFKVTGNARSALKGLQDEKEDRWLWIDAICIDQASTLERNHQLKLMCQIYRQAAVVHVWLDFKLQDDEPAVMKLSQLREESTIADLGEDPHFWKPIEAMCSNDYWTRVWVQQELHFATEMLIHCQTVQIDGHCFKRFCLLLEEKVLTGDQEDLNEYLKWLAVYQTIMASRDPRLADLPKQRNDQAYRFSNLIHALQASRKLKSTDLKDRVFAILSLVEGDIWSKFDVDYRNSLCKVYTNAAVFSIEHYGSLSFLSQVFSSSRANKLPSWVPDWSCEMSGTGQSDASECILRCTSGQGPAHPPRKPTSDLILPVFGVYLDQMNGIYRNAPRLPSATQTIRPHFFNFLNQLTLGDPLATDTGRSHFGPNVFANIPDDRWTAFLRTIFRMHHQDDRRLIEGSSQDFRRTTIQVVGEMQGNHENITSSTSDLFHAWFKAIIISSHESCFCVADSEEFSQAPDDAKIGDEIWAVLHCSKTILLRPVGQYYKVIGPCHLDGDGLYEDLVNGLPDEQKYPLRKIWLC